MNAKIDTPTPQRISVPEGTVLQIYSRDAHGNKMLMSLPGPVDISVVPTERRELKCRTRTSNVRQLSGLTDSGERTPRQTRLVRGPADGLAARCD